MMGDMSDWTMDYRPGGWARLRGDDCTAWLKLGRDPDLPARIRMEQITLVPDSGHVTEAILRAVPVAAIDLHLVMLGSVTMHSITDGGPELSGDMVMEPAKVRGYDPLALERYFDEMPAVPLGGLIPGGPVLSKPPDGRLTDEYLREVAAMYLREVRAKRSPAPMIAAAADVPVRTVHRWIAEARRRDILPKATRGKAG
jgi:hypothetical protein